MYMQDHLIFYICMYEYLYKGVIQWEVKQMKAFGDWTPFLWGDKMVEWFQALNVLQSDRCDRMDLKNVHYIYLAKLDLLSLTLFLTSVTFMPASSWRSGCRRLSVAGPAIHRIDCKTYACRKPLYKGSRFYRFQVRKLRRQWFLARILGGRKEIVYKTTITKFIKNKNINYYHKYEAMAPQTTTGCSGKLYFSQITVTPPSLT